MRDCGDWMHEHLESPGSVSVKRDGFRILVLAPHPDDEAIGCAVLLRRVIELGGEAMVAFLTTGIVSEEQITPDVIDRYGSYREYCRVRQVEQSLAQKLCGYTVPLQEQCPSRSLLGDLPRLKHLLEKCIVASAPTGVFCPAYEGAHPDHDVVNCVASHVCRQLGVPIFEYLGYHRDNGIVRYQEFIPIVGSEVYVWLALSQSELRFKERMLKTYTSQAEMILSNFWADREAFRNLPSYDYGRPPTRGMTYYEQWAAGLSKEEVCTRLITFLRTLDAGRH